jgi:hypothetical protein
VLLFALPSLTLYAGQEQVVDFKGMEETPCRYSCETAEMLKGKLGGIPILLLPGGHGVRDLRPK